MGLEHSALGKHSEYPEHYSPELLYPLARAEGRRELGLAGELPFDGVDIWHNYEASWLNARGKPEVAIARMHVPAHSPYLIESKSLKLYFNSLNFTRFASPAEFAALVMKDLSVAAGAAVVVELLPVADAHTTGRLEGVCLDELDIDFEDFSLDAGLLRPHAEGGVVTETLYSHLLRSNCPVTSQPDWGSIAIRYTGPAIDRAGLLRYLVSFRRHNEFHEHCVERVYTDILRQCRPERLSVQAWYTRRGGLDINPFRSNGEPAPVFARLARQ